MFKLVDKRYQLNEFALVKSREELKVSRSQFAFKCNWSYQYQWRLESGKYETISEATKNVIEGTLNENRM